jgi:methionyl-tRNA formyltransferase
MLNDTQPKIAIIGKKWLAAQLLCALDGAGYQLSLLTVGQADRSAEAARRLGIPYKVKGEREVLSRFDFEGRPDLILCANSHRILPGWATEWPTVGALGYHPSLLPAFKGRNAIPDTLAAGVRMTGGTVYWLTDDVDGGPTARVDGAALCEYRQVLPYEAARQLWDRALGPLGLELLTRAASLAHAGVRKNGTRRPE